MQYISASQFNSSAVTVTGDTFIWGKGENGTLGLGHSNLGVKVPTLITVHITLTHMLYIYIYIYIWAKMELWVFGYSNLGVKVPTVIRYT